MEQATPAKLTMSTSVETPNSVALWRRPDVVRLLVIALMAEIAYAELNLSTMPVYLTDKDGRNFGASSVGLVLGAFLLAEALFKTPMGHLADKFGAKRLMIAGPAVSVVTTLLSLAIPTTWSLPIQAFIFIVLRGLDGVAVAMLWPAAFAEMNATVADEDRQQSMSLLNQCYMLGIAFAFPVGGAVNDLTGHKWAGLVLAGAMFAAIAASVYRWVPNRQEHMAGGLEVHGAGLADFLASMRQIPEYLLLAVVVFVGIGFPTFIFKLFPQDQFGYSETQTGLPIFIGAILLAITGIPMTKLGQRIGRVHAVQVGLGLAAIGMCMIAVGAFIPPLRAPWLLMAGGLPCGVGFLLAVPAWLAEVSDIDPLRRGTNLGAVMTAQGVGAIIGAPTGAALYEKLQPVGKSLHLGEDFGRYSPFVACAACITAGWLLSLKILKERPKPAGGSVQEPQDFVIPVEPVEVDPVSISGEDLEEDVLEAR